MQPAVVLVPTRLGRYAQILSIGCAVHCLLTPIALAALPVASVGLLRDERIEIAALGASALLALASLLWSFRAHRRRLPLKILACGIALLMAGRVVELLETPLTIAGALSLAVSQFANRRYCRSCPQCGVEEPCAPWCPPSSLD